MITVAQGVVKALEEEGVEVAFGYPGAAVCPLYDCLSRSAIRHVLVRQEQNAAHAASGYARIHGTPGVCIATSGPGAVNLLTGLATAYMDSIPLVAITGQVPTDQIGRDVFQEADITGAAEPFTKHSYLLKDPSQAARVMKEAFHIASTGRPGPVLIDLPLDVQQTRIEFCYPDSVNIRGYKPTIAGNPPQVRRVAEAIAAARRPLLCIGGGVLAANAGEATRAFAEQCRVPMVSTMMGLSAVPTAHPLYYGMLGAFGTRTANGAVENADLIVIVGARVGDRAVLSPDVLEQRARVVHIDVDPAEIGKNLGAAIPLVGDAKNVMLQLSACMRGDASFSRAAQEAREMRPQTDEWLCELDRSREREEIDLAPREGAVNPRALLRELSARLHDDAVVVADVGQNQIWAARSVAFRAGRFLTSGGMGTMGYSLPAAIGAMLAAPGRQTVVICGDGSMQMMMMELATARRERIPVKLVLMRNGALGMVREVQRGQYGGNYMAVSLEGNPDFQALAAAYGIPSETVADAGQMAGAIGRLLGARGPYLLECVVDADEASI